MTSRHRCDALTNSAMKPLTLGAGHLWVQMSPWGMNVKWYMKHFIYHFTFSGFIAELFRASHRYRGVTGSNSQCNPSGCGAVLQGYTWIVFRGRAPSRQHSSFGPSSLSCVLQNSVWDCKKKTISKSDFSYHQMQKPDRLFVAHVWFLLLRILWGSHLSRQKLHSRLYFKSSCGVLGKVFNQQ